MNNIIVFQKNEQVVVSSIAIAAVFEKRHDNILRDIRGMLKIEHTPQTWFIKHEYINEQNNQTYEEYLLTKDGFTLLAMGLTGEKALVFKIAYIEQFNAMEKTLADERFKIESKARQKECMELFQQSLPEGAKNEKINYLKVNTVVNKAVSNYFGFKTMVKKDDMTVDMLAIREIVLDNYVKLFEVIGDATKVKEIIYNKYRQVLLA